MFVEQCFTVDYDKFLLTGKTKETLKRNVTLDIIKLIGSDNCNYNANLGELTYKVRGEPRTIFCIGAFDDKSEEKVRGSTFGGWYADEITLQPKNFRDTSRTRLSIPGSRILWTMNPDSPYHDLYTDYITKDSPDVLKMKFCLDDNPILTEAYKQELRTTYSGVFYRRMILGEWCLAEGVIYDMFSSALCLVDSVPEITKYFVACDYGTASTFVLLLFGVGVDGVVYILNEWSWDAKEKLCQKTDGEFLKELQQFTNGINISVIYPDPSATSFIALLKQNGYVVGETDNDVINGIRTVGNGLKTGKLKVHRQCVKLEKELSSAYVWDPSAQLKGLDKPLKKNDHHADTARYGFVTHMLHGHPALSTSSISSVQKSAVQQKVEESKDRFGWRNKRARFDSWLKRKVHSR